MEQPDTTVQDSAATAAPEPELETGDVLDADDQSPEIVVEDDDIEEEIDGAKVRGKKEVIEKLRSERLMQADYTRKTQAAAEFAKTVESQRAEVEQQRKLVQSNLEVVADLVSMDKQIAQFQQIDWDALADSDPAQAQKLDMRYRALKERHQQGVQAFHQLRERQAFDEQQATAKQVEQAAEVLRREVPKWSAERDTALREYAVKQGVPAERLRDVILRAPALGKILHKAELYDQLIAKQATKPKPEPQEAPVTRISATRATANKDPGQMSDADFAAWRRRQIAQRR